MTPLWPCTGTCSPSCTCRTRVSSCAAWSSLPRASSGEGSRQQGARAARARCSRLVVPKPSRLHSAASVSRPPAPVLHLILVPGPFFAPHCRNAYFLTYLVSPKTCHSFVGYLEASPASAPLPPPPLLLARPLSGFGAAAWATNEACLPVSSGAGAHSAELPFLTLCNRRAGGGRPHLHARHR